jgi:CheY-like chemotaxis protein
MAGEMPLLLLACGGDFSVLTWREFYKPLVLCVDHDEETLDLIRMALECKRYRVLTARDSSTALEAFAVCPIDAVILEYDMPGMNGADVAREMTKLKPAIPKLLFSGTRRISNEETQVFQAYCPKPDGLFSLSVQLGAMTALAGTAG